MTMDAPVIDNVFQGRLVRLGAEDPETLAEAFHRWMQDMDYYLPLDSDPPRLFSLRQHKVWEEKSIEKEETSPNSFFFSIRTLEDDRLIGFVAIWGIAWNHGDSYVSIGIGEPEYRGKGYGTDAMQTMLKVAFSELNLTRVTLFMFEYNRRAFRSYEKAGFKLEGRIRGAMQREGKRYDWLVMSVLKEEWQVEGGYDRNIAIGG
jgi:RimJ/RimL family protein N-acetyltransferase